MRTLHRAVSLRAFSLVEVLLAILILALGLLGLGAIIPAVVKMQRVSTDQTLGVVAANSAKAYLLSRPDFSVSSVSGANAWDNWLSDVGNNGWSPAGNNASNHLWQPWKVTGPNTIDEQTGNIEFNSTPVSAGLLVELSIKDRLWPTESMQPMTISRSTRDPYRPQFVWDIVGRRVATAANAPPQVQVALFVRRIDLNIRVPGGTTGQGQAYTLRDVLTGQTWINNNDRCVPVAVISTNDPTPTNRGNNGGGNRTYGNFQVVDAWFDVARRDRIELSSSAGNADTLLTLASQLDQKLVDNFGNVYTVLRTDDELSSPGTVTVVVSPAVPASVPDPDNASTPVTEQFRQVVFTPQVAAAVQVFTVTRPVK